MFENILGNEKNKQILEKSIQLNKTSHSYIFWGIEGIGKKLIAKEFAKNILCIEKKEKCQCKSCIEFDTNNNPDFQLIEPNEGKVKIEQIREMQKKVSEKPIISNKKVYIINQAEKLNVNSSNTILKFIEEPPEGIIAILVTDNIYQLLETIISRCQIISLNGQANISDKDSTISKIGKFMCNTVQEYSEFMANDNESEIENTNSGNNTYWTCNGVSFSNNVFAPPQIINIKYNPTNNGIRNDALLLFVFNLKICISLVIHALINEYNFFIIYFPLVP